VADEDHVVEEDKAREATTIEHREANLMAKDSNGHTPTLGDIFVGSTNFEASQHHVAGEAATNLVSSSPSPPRPIKKKGSGRGMHH
jgi:hypothetical protein